MRRARPDQLNEDAVPAMVLQASEHRVGELFPVPFSIVDSFAEAEPSRAALVELESGSLVAVNYGTVTHRVTVSVPVSKDVRRTIDALVRETGIQRDEVVWLADAARVAMESAVALHH
jgi:hypothetical protein